MNTSVGQDFAAKSAAKSGQPVFTAFFVSLVVAMVVVATIVANLSRSSVSDTPAEGELSPARVEQIVRNYLLREPQIIYDAIEELQRREQAERLEQMRLAALDHEDALYANPASPVGGNPDGDVTLVEFFDYRCGYCRQVVSSVEALLDDDTGVRIIYKDLPILGEDSERAARAALASDAQGAYERFHFALMRAEDFSEEGLLSLAEANGLDTVRLLDDMGSPDVSRAIEENRELAVDIGIDGTPMFIIDGKVVPGAAELELLKAMVEEARTG